MRKMLSLAAVVALSAAASLPAQAATSARTTACKSAFHLRVHNVSCKTAKSNVQKGSPGYTCKSVGQTKKPPFTVKCTKKKHPAVYYTYQTNGG